MRGIWRNEDGDLDRRLSRLREEPSEPLLDSIVAGIGGRQPRAWSRGAFAAAVVTLIVGTFASFGGVSYAASGANEAVHAVSHTVRVQSSAEKQYKPAKTIRVASVHPTTKPVTPTVAVKAQTLPFTGYSLIWTAVAGFGLLLVGVALRRREHRR